VFLLPAMPVIISARAWIIRFRPSLSISTQPSAPRQRWLVTTCRSHNNFFINNALSSTSQASPALAMLRFRWTCKLGSDPQSTIYTCARPPDFWPVSLFLKCKRATIGRSRTLYSMTGYLAHIAQRVWETVMTYPSPLVLFDGAHYRALLFSL